MLVGLTGKIGAGKTTSAHILKECCGFTEYTMADPIKQIAMIMGFEHSEVYGTQEEKLANNSLWGISGRAFLQKFGTDVCRDMLPSKIPEMSDIWVRLFTRFIKSGRAKHILVSDVRFLSEEQAIRDNGGIIIEINRTSQVPDMEWINVQSDMHQHKSETEQSQINPNYVVKNCGTLEELTVALHTVIVKHYFV